MNEKNVEELAKIGRCRWKIENETFNTLKNQGYHIEHNFGHGEKHLSFNFFLLNLLAFHQIFELTDHLYQACREKPGTKRNLWENLRVFMRTIIFPDWQTLLTNVHTPSDSLLASKTGSPSRESYALIMPGSLSLPAFKRIQQEKD